MSAAWYYLAAGQRHGPVSREELGRAARAGAVGPDDLVWTAGMPEWVEAAKVRGLFAAVAIPPPTPTARAPVGAEPQVRRKDAKPKGQKNAAAGVAALVVVLVVTCNIFRDAAGGGRTGERARGPRTPVEALTTTALVAVYGANELNADSLWKGRDLMVSGAVHSVGRDVVGNRYVILYDGDPLAIRAVQCFFPDSADDELQQLRRDDIIVVVGRCNGLMVNVILEPVRHSLGCRAVL